MFRRTRTPLALLAGILVLVGLTGCGRPRDADVVDTADLAWPAQALQAVGLAEEDLAPSAFVETAGPGRPNAGGPARPQGRHPRLRYVFQHALHGEATVRTEEGVRTVVAQRGTVTAVSGSTITVVSADDFTLAWTIASGTVVIVNRARAEIGAVAVGAEVGVAGFREGDTVHARLVVVPRK